MQSVNILLHLKQLFFITDGAFKEELQHKVSFHQRVQELFLLQITYQASGIYWWKSKEYVISQSCQVNVVNAAMYAHFCYYGKTCFWNSGSSSKSQNVESGYEGRNGTWGERGLIMSDQKITKLWYDKKMDPHIVEHLSGRLRLNRFRPYKLNEIKNVNFWNTW